MHRFPFPVRALAFDLYRERLGIGANPEDYPSRWMEALEDAEAIVEEADYAATERGE